MRNQRARGFTIVELLTILVILGILVTLIAPKLTRSRMRTFHTACLQNVHNLGTALQTYSNDHEGRFPTALAVLTEGGNPVMKALPGCPSDESSYGYEVDADDHLFTVFCQGIHDRQMDDVQKGYPQFYSSGRLDGTGTPAP